MYGVAIVIKHMSGKLSSIQYAMIVRNSFIVRKYAVTDALNLRYLITAVMFLKYARLIRLQNKAAVNQRLLLKISVLLILCSAKIKSAVPGTKEQQIFIRWYL